MRSRANEPEGIAAETPDGRSEPVREVVLFSAHFSGSVVVELFEELREECLGRDVFLLFDASSADPPPQIPADSVHTFLPKQLWSDLDLPQPRGRCPSYFPGNLPAGVLHFAAEHPEYARYWFIENDVRFTGPWHRLLDHFGASSADLLTTTVVRYPTRPDWRQWHGVRRAGKDVPREELIGAFMPIFRLTSDGCRVLQEAYAEGWEGHAECMLPTALAYAGLEIEDMGGSGEFVKEGNEGRFYWNTVDVPGLAPGSFVYRPDMDEAGNQPLTLWHPVKAPGVPTPWETTDRASISRFLVGNLSSLVSKLVGA